MFKPHQDPEKPTEQAKTTPLPSYESALHLPPDTISLALARLQSIDRLLILLICLLIPCLLSIDCSFVLYLFCFGIRMVGTTVVPLSFSWTPSCCPCPVLVAEIRCRTDGSDIQFSLDSNNHINVDLISVPPYTPTWNYLYSCVTEYQRFTAFIRFYQAQELNKNLDFMSMSRTSFSFFSVFYGSTRSSPKRYLATAFQYVLWCHSHV